MIGLHWYDLVIPLLTLLFLAAVVVALGWSIGAGYAWMRRRMARD
jgi:hypothetical protein